MFRRVVTAENPEVFFAVKSPNVDPAAVHGYDIREVVGQDFLLTAGEMDCRQASPTSTQGYVDHFGFWVKAGHAAIGRIFEA